MRCAVYNCKNNNRKRNNYSRVRFFSFPTDEYLCMKWLRFCRRKTRINPKTSCICEIHFAPENFERNLRYEMGFSSVNPTKLLRDAIPTSYVRIKISQREYERQERLRKHANKKIVDSLLRDSPPSSPPNLPPNPAPFQVIELREPPEQVRIEQAQHIKHLEEEVENLKRETNHLKEVQQSQEAEINNIKELLQDFELQRDNMKYFTVERLN